WNLARRTNSLITPRVSSSCFAFSPHHSSLAVASQNRDLELVDVPDGRRHWRRQIEQGVLWLAFHPTEPLLVVASHDKATLYFVDTQDGNLTRRVRVPLLGLTGGWLGSGRVLVTTHGDFSLRLWDWPSLETPRTVLRF